MSDNCWNVMQELAKLVAGAVHYPYSGRGMFGKVCFGIVCEASFIDELYDKAEELGLPEPKLDHMGLDYIVYWPTLQEESDCSKVIKPYA